ncbi:MULTISPECIES: Glu/Leu/Phe/Val dehydrogenase dimerization domain-containing protein [Pseudonocardia]|uniref:Leucine dehydrogenase n=2 Tax=Pseudonocardia TaxID=1847 RepID=A0A1Y2MI36_PSEAH|nr:MULTISPECIES: Glu/Leu/Phe/Val dehydrogenase dimerization domain-containing protein [Pseudonocardia]OSY34920.1 Leucine dehydrogenase [Pseudonocardia autotrophica]TDN76983.1 glutamate dehydrogenase/leucine dehydrogenase [Pseudonocardia autotrophica]BBG00987.1 leucine dehydrogenase [Pseudonocardia autotrophica]GEC29128.1 leucine dehydrogenase [Pseudonocardia saturnea]
MSFPDTLTTFDADDFEQLTVVRDPESGIRSAVAIHDTTMGPSLGGVRMRAYPSLDDAVRDAMALARAMTYKSALAGLELGGGKSVIDAEPTPANKAAFLPVYARHVASLGGRYVPGADMGTDASDMEVLAKDVPVVSSRRDPSPFTARGVLRAIGATLERAGHDGLAGRRVAVQGLGKVGSSLAGMLRAAGAEVLVADVDDDRVRAARDTAGAVAVPVGEILAADVDVLCPCAAGGVLTPVVLDALRARAIVPGANNPLADPALAVTLAGRGVDYVPDFVANAGGVIVCEAEVLGGGPGLDDEIAGKIRAIGATAVRILDDADRRGTDTVTVAHELARARLAARAAARPAFPALV